MCKQFNVAINVALQWIQLNWPRGIDQNGVNAILVPRMQAAFDQELQILIAANSDLLGSYYFEFDLSIDSKRLFCVNTRYQFHYHIKILSPFT